MCLFILHLWWHLFHIVLAVCLPAFGTSAFKCYFYLNTQEQAHCLYEVDMVVFKMTFCLYAFLFCFFFSVGVRSMCIYETLWLKARAITTLISSLFHLPPGQDSVKFSDTGQESRLRSLDTVCFERISICELAARVMDKTLWNVFNTSSCITTTCLALQCGVSCSHKFQTEI